MTEKCCEDCTYYQCPECRRFPPAPRTGFPRVSPETWCGEFDDGDTDLLLKD
jgi:hypothetical protein